MAAGDMTIKLDPEAVASIADLADSAQGLRRVFDRLEERMQREDEERRRQRRSDFEEAWPDLASELMSCGVGAEALVALRERIENSSFTHTWSLYRVADFAHFGRS